jgi:hypothetical protein
MAVPQRLVARPMPKSHELAARLLSAACLALALTSTPDLGSAEGAGSRASAPQFLFSTTLSAEPALVSSLNELFAPYFDQPVDLTTILHKLVIESAVAEVPRLGTILYNPAHLLFLYLPEGRENAIRVATLDDVNGMLKKEQSGFPALTAYTQGFESFAQLSGLMRDAGAREALTVVWAETPRSEEHKERMRYLLLRPIQQAMEIKNETSSCREEIDRFVNEVRVGKRAAIPVLPGLSNIVRPTRFIRQKDHILLILGEALIARYYVVAQMNVSAISCSVAWEVPIFVM